LKQIPKGLRKEILDIRCYTKFFCSGAEEKFGWSPSRGLNRISLVIWPEWNEVEWERSVALAYFGGNLSILF